jgi:hypothetical protein
MLPVKKSTHVYHTLDEIRQRKEELAEQIAGDNTKFTTLWNQTFIKKEDSTRGEYIASLVSKGFVAFDLLLTVRKLVNNYGFLFGLKKSKKKKRI